jgi:preprotein translocase SecE subunit
MAKTRAQRKAEQRRRQAQRAKGGPAAAEQSRAQHDTQVPESAYEVEAELAEEGANLDELTGRPTDGPAGGTAVAEPELEPVSEAAVEEVPEEAPDKISRRARRAAERERKAAAKESERRRAPKEEAPERQRGAVLGFIASCWAELKRVQWPDRETLIQASAVTVIFIAIMAAYLGVLDAIFNWLVQRIL